MNEDCLNSAKPDQFLPMKNILKIKLLNEAGASEAVMSTNNEASSEKDLNKQLAEAFAEINNAPPNTLITGQSNNVGAAVPALLKHQSVGNTPISNMHFHKKKSFGWT